MPEGASNGAAAAAPAPAPASAPADAPAGNGNGAAPPADASAADVWELDKLDDGKRKQRVRVPVGGELRELTLEEALRGYTRGQGADAKFREAAKLRREAEAEGKRFLEDPEAYAKAAGAAGVRRTVGHLLRSADPEIQAATEAALREVADEMQQPPEEVARRRKSADLDRREAEIAKREKAEADAQDAAAANERAKQYHEEFTAALKARGMPASKWALARMANAMRYALRNGIEADATWAAEAVEGEYAAERQEWTQSLQNLEGEALLSALGEPLYRKISAALVAKIRAQQATGAAPKAGAAPTPKAAAKPAPKSTEQLRAEWEEPTHKRA